MSSREKNHSVAFNFAMSTLLKVANILFPLITYPYVSRILLPEGVGKVSYATSIVSYFLIFSTMGISTYGVKETAKVKNDKDKLTKVVKELLFFTLITMSISYCALFGLLFLNRQLYAYRAMVLVCSLEIILSVIGMEWCYAALEQYSYITIRSIAFKFIGLILTLLFVRSQNDVMVYAAIVIFTSYGSYVLNFLRIRKYIFLTKRYEYDIKRHIKPMLTFFAMSIAISIYTNLDTVMLGTMQGDFQVGIYSTAVKVKTILITVVGSLGGALLPRLSFYMANGREADFYATVKKSLMHIFFMTIPMIAFFEIYAFECVVCLSGEDFVASTVPMRVLLINVIFSAVANVTGIQILIPSNKEKVYLAGVVSGASVDFLLNLVLIPACGALGAAIATVFAEGIGLAVQVIYLKKMIKDCFSVVHIVKIAAAVGAGCVSVVLLRLFEISNEFISIGVGAIVFFAVYATVSLLLKNESALYLVSMITRFVHKKSGANI